MTGCVRRTPADPAPSEQVVWPPPPAPARVSYITSFRTPEDIGIRKAWLRRFFSYLAGAGSRPELIRPYAITVTADGQIAVADPDARSVHVFDQADGTYRRIVKGGAGGMGSPVGVAADSSGRLYVSDSALARVDRFDRKGRFIDSIGGENEFLRPTGLAFDRSRRLLYIVDTLAHRLQVYDEKGNHVRSIGTRGDGDGEFNFPVAVAVGPEDRVYVADAMNFRVQVLDSSGEYLGSFGSPGTQPGSIDKAKGIAVDRDGHIYLVEALHDVIQVFDTSGNLLTVLGGTGTGPGEFWLPSGIFIDGDDRILVADSANRRVQVLKYLGEPREERQP